MENKLYLIHEEDYVKHFDEGMVLYTMLKEITHGVSKLPSERGNKALIDLAARADRLAEKIYRTWGIPASYVYTFNHANLAFLMENELIAPEDAGYYACDDTCCCQCGCCCDNCDLYDDDEEYDGEDYDDEDYDDYDEDEDETEVDDNFAELMAGLSSIAQSIFGDNVSVHIVVE
ncbi:MAG: hypothetical protein SOY49_00830 [Prevotella sp.]|nr:hypothetical protein [Prevotella sp.]